MPAALCPRQPEPAAEPEAHVARPARPAIAAWKIKNNCQSPRHPRYNVVWPRRSALAVPRHGQHCSGVEGAAWTGDYNLLLRPQGCVRKYVQVRARGVCVCVCACVWVCARVCARAPASARVRAHACTCVRVRKRVRVRKGPVQWRRGRGAPAAILQKNNGPAVLFARHAPGTHETPVRHP